MQEDAFIKEKVNEQKNQAWVTASIVLGILAYLLLFVKGFFFTVLFGLHAFNKYLPECIAIEGSDYPLSVLQVLAPSDPTIASLLEGSTNSVHVTSDFNTLLIILFFQSILLQILVCGCCCCGRTAAHNYDRMFVVYVILFIFSMGTYIWTMRIRFSHAGKVCSGDFLQVREENHLVSSYQFLLQDEFYLVQSGRLLKTHVSVESIFVLFTLCTTLIWMLVTPSAFTRLFTSVDVSQTDERRLLIENRLAFKRQMQAHEAFIFEQNKFLDQRQCQTSLNNDDNYAYLGQEEDVFQNANSSTMATLTNHEFNLTSHTSSDGITPRQLPED